MAVVLSAIFLLANISFGQYSPLQRPSAEKLAKILFQYKASLKSDNPGVRKSALYQLARIRSSFPDIDLSEILPTMKRLCVKDKEPIVRVQANLTAVYLTDSTLVTWVKTDSGPDPQAFYNRVQTAMATTMPLK